MKSKNAHIKKHVHHKLAKRMKIYFFISAIMVGIVVYEVIITWLNPLLALGLAVLGGIIGFFVSRMFHIFWDEKEQVITSRIDQIGGIILWIYLIFSFARHYLIGLFVATPLVFVVTFALVGWIMVGRFLGMRSKILKVFKGQKI